MSSTPQDPSGSNPPQWNDPQQPQQPQPPQYPGQQYPGQQYPAPQAPQGGSYPGYPAGQSAYEQQYGQYGQYQDPGQGGYGQSSGAPMKRPGTVTAAAIIAIVMSALTGLFWLLLGLAMVLAGDDITDEIQQDEATMDELRSVDISAADIENNIERLGVIAIIVGLLMLSVILLARGVLKGSKGARIGLVIASAITILLGIILIGAGISIVWIAAGIVVIVLLYVGDASRWFDSKSRTG